MYDTEQSGCSMLKGHEAKYVLENSHAKCIGVEKETGFEYFFDSFPHFQSVTVDIMKEDDGDIEFLLPPQISGERKFWQFNA